MQQIRMGPKHSFETNYISKSKNTSNKELLGEQKKPFVSPITKSFDFSLEKTTASLYRLNTEKSISGQSYKSKYPYTQKVSGVYLTR